MYALIQNPGEAPIEGYTLLGMSTTRGFGGGTIGQFGSGTKHAINTLLRAGLKVVVYCGKTRLEFATKPKQVDDGLKKIQVDQVVCKISGTQNKTLDLGFCLEFGSMDWDDVRMALREFVSNAIDRSIRETGSHDEVVLEQGIETPRAKSGHTRVYVEINETVSDYFGNIDRYFLHFHSNKPGLGLIEKESLSPVKVYREGVLVTTLEDESVYDYNLSSEQLSIDECRNSNPYTIRAACAKRITGASARQLACVIKSVSENAETLEATFDPYYVAPWSLDITPELKNNWCAAWGMVAGNALACVSSSSEYVKAKGHKPYEVNNNWLKSLSRIGVPSVLDLTKDNSSKEVSDATSMVLASLARVWSKLEALNLTNGKEKPEAFCFEDLMDAGGQVFGYCEFGKGVFVHKDISENASVFLDKVMWEEVAHWVTGSDDLSRDFQDFLLNVITRSQA